MSSQERSDDAVGPGYGSTKQDEMFEKAKPANRAMTMTARTLSRQTGRGTRTPTGTGLAARTLRGRVSAAVGLRLAETITGLTFAVPPRVTTTQTGRLQWITWPLESQ